MIQFVGLQDHLVRILGKYGKFDAINVRFFGSILTVGICTDLITGRDDIIHAGDTKRLES